MDYASRVMWVLIHSWARNIHSARCRLPSEDLSAARDSPLNHWPEVNASVPARNSLASA